MKHSEIIEAKGTALVSERTGRPAAHVRVWKNRGIPRSVWAELIDAFPDITLEALKSGPANEAANDTGDREQAA